MTADGHRSPYYTYEFRIDGRLYKGSTGKTKKREAELFERDRYDEAVAGVTPGAIKPITFSALADEYLRLHGATMRSASFYDAKVAVLKRHFKESPVAGITAADCAAFKADRLTLVGNATVRSDVTILKHLLNKAEEWGYLADGANPARRVKCPKVRNSRDHYLRVEDGINEMADLMAACDDWLKPIYLTALCTGARRGDLLRLTVADVHLDAGRIMFLGRKNNNSTSHDIGRMVIDTLRPLTKNHPAAALFMRDGKPVDKRMLRSGFEAAVKKAGLVWRCGCVENNNGQPERTCGKCHGSGRDTFTLHGVRHTWATYVAESGTVSPKRLQYLGGWEDAATMDRYIKLMPERPRITAATYAEAQDAIFAPAMRPVLSKSYQSTSGASLPISA
jgi:integrase